MLRVELVSVGEGSTARARDPEAVLAERYRTWASRYQPCAASSYRTERALLEAVELGRQRHPIRLMLFDSTGEMLASKALASRIGRLRDDGVHVLMAAIGPADGWSRDTLARADMVLSFGPLTLPHRLATVLLAEQVYRALTILAGHPYHCGH